MSFGQNIQPGMDIYNLPCGQCIGCRLDHSKMWATRCVHESRLHEENSFITLTYSDEEMPIDRGLRIEHLQKFMKRLRKFISHKKIKFFACGEYSPQKKRPIGPFNPYEYLGEGQRPHYHACIFGHDFPDKELWSVRDDISIYVSSSLNDLWGKGHCTTGDVTFESAAYVARYALKKINGEGREKLNEIGLRPYERVCPVTGSIIEVDPEFVTMSRGGRTGKGLAREFYEQFKEDIYPWDHVIHKGRKLRPPRYYDGIYDAENPEQMKEVKNKRLERMRKHKWNNTPERLAVRKEVKLAQLNQLKRDQINEI
jgi:hypothetical protein